MYDGNQNHIRDVAEQGKSFPYSCLLKDVPSNTFLTMYSYVGFDVLTAVTIGYMVFWVVTPCSLEKAGRFGGISGFLQITRHYNPDNSMLQSTTILLIVTGSEYESLTLIACIK
jgi:hypothetical protein